MCGTSPGARNRSPRWSSSTAALSPGTAAVTRDVRRERAEKWSDWISCENEIANEEDRSNRDARQGCLESLRDHNRDDRNWDERVFGEETRAERSGERRVILSLDQG